MKNDSQTPISDESWLIELSRSSGFQKDLMANLAKSLKQDQFKLIVLSLRQKIQTEWEKCPTPEGREALHAEARVLRRVEKRISSLAQYFDRSVN